MTRKTPLTAEEHAQLVVAAGDPARRLEDVRKHGGGVTDYYRPRPVNAPAHMYKGLI